jgi:hypothetical protein
MLRVPEDLEAELIKKYPNDNVKAIIQSVFLGVLEKTLKDGGCAIKEFGNFRAYKTYSAKLSVEVVRFKFAISPSLEKKIRCDSYLLNNMTSKAKVPFTEHHQSKCNTEIKLLNAEAGFAAIQKSKQITNNKIMSNLVQTLLDEEQT